MLNRLFAFWIGATFLACMHPEARSQNVVDPSVCFPSILRDAKFENTSDDFRLSYLSIIDRDNYEQHRQKVEAAGILPKFAANLAYEKFDELRTHEFQYRSLSISSLRTFAGSTFSLNVQAKAIIDSCLTAISSNRYGLTIVPFVIDESLVSFQFRYNSTDIGKPLVIRSSALLHGAVVAPKGTPAGSLFKPGQSISRSLTVLVSRDDPYLRLVAQIEPTNQLDIPAISIAPVPARVNCTTRYVDTDPKTNIPYAKDISFELDGHYYVPTRNGRVGARFWYSYKPSDDAVMSSIICDKGVQDHMCMDNTPNGSCDANPGAGVGLNTNTATCEGSSESNPRVVTMRMRWRIPAIACDPVPWPRVVSKK